MVLAETRIIPALSVTGTYDSNVFYTPKSLLSPGTKPEDYYAMITPQIIASHTGSSITGSLSVGALVTKYVNNPSLDYTGINASGMVDLRNYVYKFVPRIESLSVMGTYQYTPSMSAFGASGVGSMSGGFGTVGVVGPLDAGLVASRVSMQNIMAMITGGYRLTPVTSMSGNFSYTQLKFGNQSGGLNNQFFDTSGQTGVVTLTTRLSARDSVGTTTTLSHFEQSGSSSTTGGGGGSGSFTTINGMLNWGRQWSREFNTSLSGGGLLTLPIESQIPGEKIKSQLTPTALALLSYTSYSETLKAAGASLSSLSPFEGLPPLAGSLQPGAIFAPGRYNATLSYNLSVFPSYAFGAGPMKAHVIGANATAGLTSNLTANGGLNYSHGSINTPASTFDTVGLTGGLNYLFGSSFVGSITYSWLYFANSGGIQGGTVGEDIAFSKKMIMVSLSYAFNSRQFFRAGSFSSIGGGASNSPTPSPNPIPDMKLTN
ncbi:hypothetical protein W02_12860 [Nitrospira sp. KM1]|nr:hypothetical protein W02_12860 [Nitrospira sp. KM1]